MALSCALALFKADLAGPEVPFIRWVVSQNDVVEASSSNKQSKQCRFQSSLLGSVVTGPNEPSNRASTWLRLSRGHGPPGRARSTCSDVWIRLHALTAERSHPGSPALASRLRRLETHSHDE